MTMKEDYSLHWVFIGFGSSYVGCATTLYFLVQGLINGFGAHTGGVQRSEICGIREKVIPSRLYLKVGYTNLGYTIRPFGITYLRFGITYFFVSKS